jgi:tetratricopeptide (TPR) repeat protein
MTATLIEAMRRIDELLRAGRFRAAHDQLETLVAANPGFVEGLRLLAGTRQALGDPRAAEEILRRALALDPNWTPTLATLGELLLGSGRGSEAEPLLRRAVNGSPPYPRAALLLARYYNECGSPDRALEVASPLCQAGKADAELATQHISALTALGRQAEAVTTYRNVAASAPDNLAALHALAISLNATGQFSEAEHVARHALTRGYETAALYNTYARSLTSLGAHETAETALLKCLERDPRLLEAHNSLAQLVWVRTGDLKHTTASLDAALRTFANDEALWATKAAILQGAGDPRAAYACLADRVAGPNASPTLLVRAGLAALEFDPATALRLAERALRALPANTPARTLLAAAKLGTGDAQGALTDCEPLLVTAPDNQYLIALQTTAWRLLNDERYGQLCDYSKLVLPLQLETPPPWPDMASFLAELRVSLNRLHDPQGHALLFQSLRHGTETTQDLSRSSDPVIRALFSAFAAPIDRYLEHIGSGPDPLRRRNRGRWRFNGSWSVRLRTSGFHTNHVHPRGWISSACYIELPDSMSPGNTQEGFLTFGELGIVTSPTLSAEHSIRPSPGMLVLFPSYLWHGTVPFSSSQARLTVAFDAVPEQ